MPLAQYRKNCPASHRAKGQIRFQTWTSLVVQQLRIHLPMQRTRVRSLVRGDSTCCGTSKPMGHNHWPCALETMHSDDWNPRPRAWARQEQKPPQGERQSSKTREEHPLPPLLAAARKSLHTAPETQWAQSLNNSIKIKPHFFKKKFQTLQEPLRAWYLQEIQTLGL